MRPRCLDCNELPRLKRMANCHRWKYYHWLCKCGKRFHTRKLLPYDMKNYKKLIIRRKKNGR